MYARRIKAINPRLCSVVWKYNIRIKPYWNHACPHSFSVKGIWLPNTCWIQRHSLGSFYSGGFSSRHSYPGSCAKSAKWISNDQFRVYSSEGDGSNTSGDNCGPVGNGPSLNEGKSRQGELGKEFGSSDAHAHLGEHDQKEWLKNEKISIESRKKESPFLNRREKFKNEFLRRVVSWERILVSLESFPYHIQEHTKNLLVECITSHLKHKKFSASFGARLSSSSGRILLQSVPGTELYRERLVRAIARDLQVPLLVLDSSVLAPYDFGDDSISENETDDDNMDAGEEATSESEVEDENDAGNDEEWTSSSDARTDCSDEEVDVTTAEAALKKLVPYSEEFEKRIFGESENASSSTKSGDNDSSEKARRQFRKGDRVKYIGPDVQIKADNRQLSSGQHGEVYEVSGDRAAVILDVGPDNKKNGVRAESGTGDSAKPTLYWIDVKEIELDLDAQAEDCYIAIQALCEVLRSLQPIIVYFPDSSQWLSRAVPKANRKEFVRKVNEMFNQLSGPVVLICGLNRVEAGSKEKEKFTMILPNFGRLAKLPLSLKRLTEGLKGSKRSDDSEISKLFNNVFSLHPPKEEDILRVFNKQLEEDRKIVIYRSNLIELHKVLEENELSCMDLLRVDSDGVILTKWKAEKVVGWAKNHYLSSCPFPLIKGDKLCLPRESLEVAIQRLKEQETTHRKPSQNLKNLARDEYESNFISAVVPPGEIGVKFDDVGALEEVKKALKELVILPMSRPELFSHGNLLRPCKGILLFGPPGTGKTLLAKALATEAGANFISITGSTLTSKWFGDAEKLTKALFSFATRLAPVIIFVDEVDSLLGARGGAFEHEATRRMRNEFMAAWDGLRSKDSERILILGATNRPFDLDDAVIRRLPRRLYVDLPDAGNRMKVLDIILSQENLEANFPLDRLADATEGYSGSDLKNLCVAAAYRPVQELLEEEKKGGKNDSPTALRPLVLDDFLQSKAKVGPSVAYDASSMNELRKWNEQYGEGGNRRKAPFGF